KWLAALDHFPQLVRPGPSAREMRKGNRQMRRVLNQAANASAKAKGTIFAVVYRRLVPRLGHAHAIGAITHRLCRLIGKILHQGIRYEERGQAVTKEARQAPATRESRASHLHAMSVSAGRWETSRRCKAASVRLRLSRDRWGGGGGGGVGVWAGS